MANCMTRDNWLKLEAKLLGLGGRRVEVLSGPEVDQMLTRGQVFTSAGRRQWVGISYMAGSPAALHYMALVLEHRRDIELVFGHQLGENGVWSSHSWLWDGTRVIDSTNATLYHGVRFTPDEAQQVVSGLIASCLPGGGFPV